MRTVDRSIKLPLYLQIYEIFKSKILVGEWVPGQMIPPEPLLIDQYRVSRSGIRQALDRLVKEGFIYRQQGRGTFVTHPTMEKEMTGIVSFTEDMRRQGFTPSTLLLAAELLPAPEPIAERLSVKPGEELAHLKRLRLADGEPMSLETAFLLHRLCPGILQKDYSQVPLRDALKYEHAIFLVRARQKIRALLADEKTARLLGVKPKAPLLSIERISYSQQNIPVEFLEILYRGDRYTLYNELKG
ncbi:MAG TPA: GntR family transcriptional regulator [Atribacteraceae bacterium]|nr:GntR family transcriptional regulator [Atribacteraceae bacterium]